MSHFLRNLLIEQVGESNDSAENRAFTVAGLAHFGQTRVGLNQPYVVHLIDVHGLVAAQPGSTLAMRVAAILHDSLEDTCLSEQKIAQYFGAHVRDLVVGVTDCSRPKDGNRATRKEIDRLHLVSGNEAVQTIKLCDVQSNARDIVVASPTFAKVWLQEKIGLVMSLTKGPIALRERVEQLLRKELAVVTVQSDVARIKQPKLQ